GRPPQPIDIQDLLGDVDPALPAGLLLDEGHREQGSEIFRPQRLLGDRVQRWPWRRRQVRHDVVPLPRDLALGQHNLNVAQLVSAPLFSLRPLFGRMRNSFASPAASPALVAPGSLPGTPATYDSGKGGPAVGDDAGLVRTMAVVRMISSAIELAAALLMLRLGRLDAAVQTNAALGMAGPLVLVTVTLVGVAGLAGKRPVARPALLGPGVVLVILSARRWPGLPSRRDARTGQGRPALRLAGHPQAAFPRRLRLRSRLGTLPRRRSQALSRCRCGGLDGGRERRLSGINAELREDHLVHPGQELRQGQVGFQDGAHVRVEGHRLQGALPVLLLGLRDGLPRLRLAHELGLERLQVAQHDLRRVMRLQLLPGLDPFFVDFRFLDGRGQLRGLRRQVPFHRGSPPCAVRVRCITGVGRDQARPDPPLAISSHGGPLQRLALSARKRPDPCQSILEEGVVNPMAARRTPLWVYGCVAAYTMAQYVSVVVIPLYAAREGLGPVV